MFTTIGVPIEFLFPFLIWEDTCSIFYTFTCIIKKKQFYYRNTRTKKIHGSYDQETSEEESKIRYARFRSNWTKNLCSDNW